jgi:hypothetical protein
MLATSLYDDPAAGLCGDAPAWLDEHPEAPWQRRADGHPYSAGAIHPGKAASLRSPVMTAMMGLQEVTG